MGTFPSACLLTWGMKTSQNGVLLLKERVGSREDSIFPLEFTPKEMEVKNEIKELLPLKVYPFTL